MKRFILIIFLIYITAFTVYAQKESDFLFETIPGNRARITGFSGNAEKIRIPNIIQGMLVTEIGDEAFLGKGLTKVTLPRNLIIIGEGAFKNNNLTDINFPVNVTTVKTEAFKGNKLKTLTIPFNIKIIEAEAFTENRIEKIRIGANVDIPNNAFDNRFSAVYQYFDQKAGTYIYSNNFWMKK